MQLTRAADYAVRVMMHMAGLPPGTRTSRTDLANAASCPEQFLSKVLQDLTHAGLVTSHPREYRRVRTSRLCITRHLCSKSWRPWKVPFGLNFVWPPKRPANARSGVRRTAFGRGHRRRLPESYGTPPLRKWRNSCRNRAEVAEEIVRYAVAPRAVKLRDPATVVATLSSVSAARKRLPLLEPSHRP